MTIEEKARVLEEEEQRVVLANTDFHQTQMEMLKSMQTYDPLISQSNFARRSIRCMRASQDQLNPSIHSGEPMRQSEKPLSQISEAPASQNSQFQRET